MFFKPLVNSDLNIKDLEAGCRVQFKWEEADYNKLRREIEKHDHQVDMSKIDLHGLKENLSQHKDLLLNLIANPNLFRTRKFFQNS